MELFSVRYGYTHPSDVIIREDLPIEVQNAICSSYDILPELFHNTSIFAYLHGNFYKELELHIWVYFFNFRQGDFYTRYEDRIVAISYLEDDKVPWYNKLDLIEFTIDYLRSLDSKHDPLSRQVSTAFVTRLNSEFKRLNFAYRIVDDRIVEITSDEEIKSIDTALAGSDTKVKEHLSKALDHYAKRPKGDYRNSIKESISAVEAYCRERTGKNTLGDAIKALKKSGITLHPLLETSLTKLYAYTNQPDTGIRHSLMDDSEGYTPGADEALFMLVTCSAFINYLRKK